ncbi:MFS transporter [Acuticoccus kandeliae]|uniref:MFS transporter n=1 Tax=Acuticoccus kandeliae TaxID=2073160 RepID=UPI000D3E5C5A|nr:MFS transporter [Acuticoccus kandeliae]
MRWSFYRQNAWWLTTGALLTFGSAFGQTYFISLFSGGIRREFGLSDGEWGGIYTFATFASAACLFQLGGLADTRPLARLTVAVLLLYALAATIMLTATGPIMLTLAVFGLRFCGQGMMSHISMTAMARWFRANRGRAASIAIVGYPLGEAFFPLVTVGIIAALGWRLSWAVAIAIILLVFLPLLFVLMRHGRVPQGEGGGEEAVGMEDRHWTRAEVLRHWSVWALLPAVLAPPFIGTCVIFHQVHISVVRGFDLATMALAFPVYAAISLCTTLVAGTAIDRFGPTRLLPFFLVPTALGVAMLAVPGGVGLWFAVLAGIAMSQGVAATLLAALWPTLYGTRHIGSIKALVTSAMVFSTALGPGVTGWLIDLGVTIPEQALFMSAYCAATTVLLTIVATRLTGALPAPVRQTA